MIFPFIHPFILHGKEFLIFCISGRIVFGKHSEVRINQTYPK
jgi:hypothetical protein